MTAVAQAQRDLDARCNRMIDELQDRLLELVRRSTDARVRLTWTPAAGGDPDKMHPALHVSLGAPLPIDLSHAMREAHAFVARHRSEEGAAARLAQCPLQVGVLDYMSEEPVIVLGPVSPPLTLAGALRDLGYASPDAAVELMIKDDEMRETMSSIVALLDDWAGQAAELEAAGLPSAARGTREAVARLAAAELVPALERALAFARGD